VDEDLTILLYDQMLERLRQLRMNYLTLVDKASNAALEVDLLINDLEDRKRDLEAKLCQKKSTTQS